MKTLILGLLIFTLNANAELCGNAFKIGPLPQELTWRRATTQFLPSGEGAATSANRENFIQAREKSMEDFILNFHGDFGIGDVPPMQFIPAEGEHIRALGYSSGLNGTITRFAVSGIGAKASVDGTLLLPVSGHQGNANARAWALTDTYQIRLDSNPNQTPSTHSSWGRTGKETILLKDIKSLALVTKQEVTIPLIANIPVVVLYYRKGSAGPSGYVEGRVMEFIWDGT